MRLYCPFLFSKKKGEVYMYCSDVRFVTNPRGYALLTDVAEDGTATGVVLDGLKDLLEIADKTEYHEKAGYILLGWDEIEWDKNGKREQAFYAALDELDARWIPYRFIRVGEQAHDIEERYGRKNLWQLPDLYVVRTIKVWPDDGPGQDLKFLKCINPKKYEEIRDRLNLMVLFERG
jgi:hypothetical protein